MTRGLNQIKSEPTREVPECNKRKIIPFNTVLYGTLLVILKTRLVALSGPLAFLSFELFEGGSSSSEASSMLHSCGNNKQKVLG